MAFASLVRPKVAIVGSGISGLMAAHALQGKPTSRCLKRAAILAATPTRLTSPCRRRKARSLTGWIPAFLSSTKVAVRGLPGMLDGVLLPQQHQRHALAAQLLMDAAIVGLHKAAGPLGGAHFKDLSSEITQGRSDQGSSPCSRPPQSHARTPAASRCTHGLPQGLGAGSSNQRRDQRRCPST